MSTTNLTTRKPRSCNKTTYNIRSLEIDDDLQPVAERFWKTMLHCGEFYNCSQRLIGYKLKDKNKKNVGKLRNINFYYTNQPIEYYPQIEKDITKILGDQPEYCPPHLLKQDIID